MSAQRTVTFPLSGNPLKLAQRARLAGFDVKHATVDGTVGVMGQRQGGLYGLTAFRCIWRHDGPKVSVVFVGWWPFSSNYTSLIAELDRGLTPLDV